MVSLVNGILGVGILGFPYAFKQCGLILAFLVIISIFCVCLFSTRLLLYCSQMCGKNSYEDIAYFTFGKTGRSIVHISILSVNFGAMVMYLNVIADVLSSFSGTIIPPGLDSMRSMIIIGTTIFAAIPISLLIQDADSMAFVSKLTVYFLFIFSALVVILATFSKTSVSMYII